MCPGRGEDGKVCKPEGVMKKEADRSDGKGEFTKTIMKG
jgi:hypothetical protein